MNMTFVYVVEAILLIIMFVFIIFLLIAKRSLYLEKRITKYSISSITYKPSSLFDRVFDKYRDFVSYISNVLSKFSFAINYSKKYEKYLASNSNNALIDVVSTKIITSFTAIVLTFISDVLRRHDISVLQIIIAFIIGFFVPDLYLRINYRKRKKKLEDDLFKAVIIMSNAFKSGRSIMQAVKIVYEELDGDISDEFKKVYIDLSYGLDLDVVFERLSNRIKLDETKYLASSLVILNKTGGNVVKVFDSIERSFFERKKINDELNSVTALSKFVFLVLITIPIIIFVMISILNPSYFSPFISSGIGKIMLSAITFLYLLYIVVVRKMIKIRE